MGVRISSFWEPYMTTKRPRGQTLQALERTRAETYHTNESGRLSLLIVATASSGYGKRRKNGKIIL
jgi:hypothetical protein